jgi:hypothetical protein
VYLSYLQNAMNINKQQQMIYFSLILSTVKVRGCLKSLIYD